MCRNERLIVHRHECCTFQGLPPWYYPLKAMHNISFREYEMYSRRLHQIKSGLNLMKQRNRTTLKLWLMGFFTFSYEFSWAQPGELCEFTLLLSEKCASSFHGAINSQCATFSNLWKVQFANSLPLSKSVDFSSYRCRI